MRSLEVISLGFRPTRLYIAGVLLRMATCPWCAWRSLRVKAEPLQAIWSRSCVAVTVPSRIWVPSYSPLCAAPCRDLPGRER